jgi:hypothetical protein
LSPFALMSDIARLKCSKVTSVIDHGNSPAIRT